MNRTEIIRSELAGESCLYCKHPTGLDIFIKEMEGYHSAYALFATKYGSINTRFRLRGEADFAEVPEGIAHFLEHKLFENEDCDAFEQYAKTGASANAYTSFDQTAYLFGCSEHFTDSLRILINTVQNPYFTQETVDKEQGIIAQEIRMGEDNPGLAIYYNLLKMLYAHHPIRDRVAGTVESIAILQTKLRRNDGTTVFIPNGKLSDAVILNYSETPERRLDLEFGIGYGSDAEAAKTLILEKIAKHPYTLQNPAPTVRIGSLGDSAVMIWVRVWTTHVHYWEVHYDLQEQVYEAFRENGIEIPYPQLDIHTDLKGDPT